MNRSTPGPPCPSPTPGVYSDWCPSSQWCHSAISSSFIRFSVCPQSLPASESFPMSQLFTWGGQSTGVSALASFLPKNTQDWSKNLTINNSREGEKRFKGKRSSSVTLRELKAAVIIYEMPVLRYSCYILFLPVGFSSCCGYSQGQWDIDFHVPAYPSMGPYKYNV